jgi:hypothetical protein
MSLLSHEEFESILPKSIQNDPLIDRHVFDIIYSYNDFKDYNEGLGVGCEIGNEDLVIVMIKKGATDWDRGSEMANKGGHLNLVKWMIEKGAKWQWAFFDASFYGHMHIVQYLYTENIKNIDCKTERTMFLNNGLIKGCTGGHMKIVKWMIEKGANDLNWALEKACCKGNIEIVKYLLEKGANNINKGLHRSCGEGHMDLITMFVEKGANDWNGAFVWACENGDRKIIDYLIDKGADDWNGGLSGGAAGGHVDVVNYMISKGANKFKEAMREASFMGHTKIKNILLEKYAYFNLKLYDHRADL